MPTDRPLTPAPRCLSCGATDVAFWAEAQDLEYFTANDRYRYFRCPHCRSLSISPVPEDRLGLIYPAHYYAYSDAPPSWLQRIKLRLDRRRLRRLLADLPGDRLRVLDVGGGSGFMLDVLRAADARVSVTQVVDTDPHSRAPAEAKGHAYFCGPLEAFTAQTPFDLVLMLNLIEHVKNPAALLAHAKSLLSPQGMLLIKTPNVDCWDARLFRHRNWGAYHCPRHWVLFDRAGVESLVRSAGLQVSSVRYTQGATFWAGTLLMALHRRGWVNVGATRPLEKHPLYAALCAFFALFDSARSLWFSTSQMFVTVRRG